MPAPPKKKKENIRVAAQDFRPAPFPSCWTPTTAPPPRSGKRAPLPFKSDQSAAASCVASTPVSFPCRTAPIGYPSASPAMNRRQELCRNFQRGRYATPPFLLATRLRLAGCFRSVSISFLRDAAASTERSAGLCTRPLSSSRSPTRLDLARAASSSSQAPTRLDLARAAGSSSSSQAPTRLGLARAASSSSQVPARLGLARAACSSSLHSVRSFSSNNRRSLTHSASACKVDPHSPEMLLDQQRFVFLWGEWNLF
jgi:hypothetical protein